MSSDPTPFLPGISDIGTTGQALRHIGFHSENSMGEHDRTTAGFAPELSRYAAGKPHGLIAAVCPSTGHVSRIRDQSAAMEIRP